MDMDVNVLLFNDFETLDVFGPVEILGRMSNVNMNFFSVEGGVITSKQKTQIVTLSIKDIDPTGILVIPGGQGTRQLVNDVSFIEHLREVALMSEYCLTVCTGSALLAKTGLLDGRRATSNKRAFEWVKSVSNQVKWIEKARWCIDEKYYTSSGVSAGMDMCLGFIADLTDKATAEDIAWGIEYVWGSDKECDPFS